MITVDASVWVAAMEARDRFHADSVAFLRALARQDERPVAPALILAEVGGAIARRSGQAEAGARAVRILGTHPRLRLLACDEALMRHAAVLAAERRLRGADAVYAATAAVTGSALVTWDAELRARAEAVSPEELGLA